MNEMNPVLAELASILERAHAIEVDYKGGLHTLGHVNTPPKLVMRYVNKCMKRVAEDQERQATGSDV